MLQTSKPQWFYKVAILPGDAYFYDLSVRDNLDAIRSTLGVCPQHDVLWGDLTAMEHMKLFGNLKDIPREVMENEIATLLAEVQLDKVCVCWMATQSFEPQNLFHLLLSFLLHACMPARLLTITSRLSVEEWKEDSALPSASSVIRGSCFWMNPPQVRNKPQLAT